MDENTNFCEELAYQNGTTEDAKKTNEIEKSSQHNYNNKITGRYCLAKWSDRKYYPGFVSDQSGPNKFMISYEDGYKKVCPEANLILCELNSPVLPILNQTVSITAEKTIVGNCIEIQLTSGKPKYTILTEMGSLVVESNEIFLTEDQVKMMKGTYKSNGYSHYNGNGVRRSNRKRRVDDGPNSPQAGPSGLCLPKRSKKAVETEQVDSDDSEYLSDPEPEPIKKCNLWDIEGVQTETLVTQADQDRHRLQVEENLGNNFEETLGKFTENKRLFRGKCFLLTCTYPLNDKKKMLANNRFTSVPFVRSHLEAQIKAGGGVIYQCFQNVPKSKYKSLRLIAPYSCLTPKFIQCLSAGVPVLSHQWIIDCSNQSKLLDYKDYLLPSGFSVIEEKFIELAPERSISHRKQFLPFKNATFIIGSFETDFIEFWKNVCKNAGAIVRIAKRGEDITATLNGYLLAQEEFFYRNKEKVEYFNIPIVSTVFVIESLICGKVFDPNVSDKMREFFEDEDEPDV